MKDHGNHKYSRSKAKQKKTLKNCIDTEIAIWAVKGRSIEELTWLRRRISNRMSSLQERLALSFLRTSALLKKAPLSLADNCQPSEIGLSTAAKKAPESDCQY
ncbi:hypothetical protein CEXT_525191 [Caerostris extrusa]|uniref:Uncharacterized protein n=1 Tax=Caerostris extrusa TaxID=172846 RepID=A0AAV4T5C7_CAEEX|nr:hypothetical protein CEXT_525191 [Caerostris extrusa]